MNTDNESEVEIWTDKQWWVDFRAIYAISTRQWQKVNERLLLEKAWNSGQLDCVAEDAGALDLDPLEAVRKVFRLLLLK